MILIALLCCLVAGHPVVEDRALSIRAPAEVGDVFHPAELVERIKKVVNTPLFAAGLTAFGAVTYGFCQSSAPVIPYFAISEYSGRIKFGEHSAKYLQPPVSSQLLVPF